MNNTQINQITALKAELHRTKEQKRELNKQLAIASINLDFPKPNQFVQNWHDSKYGKENWITTLSWKTFDIDSEPFNYLIVDISRISEDLAFSIEENGFDYEIRLPYESFSCNGYQTGNLGFDCGEWERFHYGVWEALDDDEKDEIKDIISQFGEIISNELVIILKQNDVGKDDYFKFISEDDLIQSLIKIKSSPDDNIKTSMGYLCGRGGTFDEWEFINKYRGRLVGFHQIFNPVMLPESLKNQSFFVIE